MLRVAKFIFILPLLFVLASCSTRSLSDLGVETEAQRLQRECKADKNKGACVRQLMIFGGEAELQKKVSFWEDNCAKDPPSAWACLRLGYYFEFTGRLREALHAWGRSCTADSPKTDEFFDVCLAAGRLSREQEELEAARTFYGEACKHGRKEACVAVSEALYHEGQVKDATAKLQQQCLQENVTDACLYLATKQRALTQDGEANTLLAHACEQTPGQACVLLAQQKFRGGDAAKREQAAKLYAKACAAGDQDGCMQIGVQHELAGRRQQAQEIYAQGCEQKHGESCLRYAGLLEAAGEQEKAWRAKEQACAYGLTQTCQVMAGQRKQVDDAAGARLLLRAACEQQDDSACLQLAQDHAEAKEFSHAEDFLTRVCNRNNWDGCLRLASQYQAQGKLESMASVFKRMCRMGSQSGCVALSHYHLDQKQYPAAEAAVAQLCHDGYLEACYPLMQVYAAQNLEAKVIEVGTSTCKRGFVGGCNALVPFAKHPQLSEQVMDFLQQACNQLAIIPACAPLGRALRERGDRSAALKLLERTCNKNDALACEELGVSLWVRGRPDDRQRGEALLADACKQRGRGQACEELGRFLNSVGREGDANRYFTMACGLGLQQHCPQHATKTKEK